MTYLSISSIKVSKTRHTKHHMTNIVGHVFSIFMWWQLWRCTIKKKILTTSFQNKRDSAHIPLTVWFAHCVTRKLFTIYLFRELWTMERSWYSHKSYGRKLDWFSQTKLLSFRYSNIELNKIFSRIFPRIGNKETGLEFCNSYLSSFLQSYELEQY